MTSMGATCSAVDIAQIATAIAAGAAVLVSIWQAKKTAEVNRETLNGLREQSAQRTEDAAYNRWLSTHLAEQRTVPNVATSDLPPEEVRFFERAIRERASPPVARTVRRFLLGGSGPAVRVPGAGGEPPMSELAHWDCWGWCGMKTVSRPEANSTPDHRLRPRRGHQRAMGLLLEKAKLVFGKREWWEKGVGE
jgi:hypothetical protein